MNLYRFMILGAAVGAIAACSSDNTSPTVVTPGPHALVHFINAVPDTGFIDFRFVDTIEGVPNVEFVNLPFRGGTNVGYQPVSEGSHHIRAFMGSANLAIPGNSLSSNNPAIVSTVMADTTFTFVAGVHYTFALTGASRAKAQKFIIFTDAFTIPTTWSLRAGNLTTAAADFYVNQTVANTSSPVAITTASTSVSGTPTFAAVASYAATNYTSFNLNDSKTGTTVTATSAGTTTPVWSAGIFPGSPAVAEVTGVSGALAALPGTRIAGSIFSAWLFPASVSGSQAASFANPGVLIQSDRFF
jgi:hypothetical protein